MGSLTQQGPAAESANARDSEHLQERMGFLSSFSYDLAQSRDLDVTLGRIATRLVPGIADVCTLELRGEDGCLRTRAALHRDPRWQPAIEEVTRSKSSLERLNPRLRAAVERGHTVAQPVVSADLLVAPPLASGLRWTSSLFLPLNVGTRNLGVIVARWCDPEWSSEVEELAFVEELAGRAALAIDNAQSFRRAADAVGEREELLTAVSHDLANPLGVLKALLQLERGALRARGEDGATRRIDAMARAVDRMSRLVSDLLDRSSLRRGQFTVEVRREVPSLLIAELMEGFLVVARNRGITLEFSGLDALPAVLADAIRLAQALSNLVGNALKFTPAGGRIRVSAEVRPSAVALSVSDTGSGIPPEHLPHIFDRYWRGSSGPSPGQGLGLFISKGIVEAQGGELTVENQEGSGARFTLTIPRADPG